MANAFKTQEINFEGATSELSLGKNYDKLPAADLSNGNTNEKRKEEVRASLPPWMTQPDDKTLNWEHKRESKIIDLRQHPTYQFVMLVTSFTNEKMSKYWVAPSENQAEHLPGSKEVGKVGSGFACSFKSKKESMNEANQNFHSYYIDSPWIEGIIYLSPSIYGHIEEAYVAITQKHQHLAKVPLNLFIVTPRIRTMFAKLVAFGIRSSDFLSQKRYNLDSTYTRLNMEKRRIMNYWRHVQYMDNTLYYFHIDGSRLDYKVNPNVNPFQINNDAEVGDMFKLSISIAANNVK